MDLSRRTALLVALLLASAPFAGAQSPVDPSGHWTGALQAPDTEVNVNVDFAKNAKGQIVGTLSLPGEQLNGLPLTSITIEGRSITFYARTDQTYTGVLAADGKTIGGDFTGTGPLGGNFTLPFSLTKSGPPQIEPPVKSPAITKQLAGKWNAALQGKGAEMKIVLTLANQPDGTSSGRLVNIDQGSIEIPVVITQKGSNVTLELRPVRASFDGVLNAAGTELAGTYKQGPSTFPVTFHRAAASGTR